MRCEAKEVSDLQGGVTNPACALCSDAGRRCCRSWVSTTAFSSTPTASTTRTSGRSHYTLAFALTVSHAMHHMRSLQQLTAIHAGSLCNGRTHWNAGFDCKHTWLDHLHTKVPVPSGKHRRGKPDRSFHAEVPQLLRPGGVYSFFNGLAADNAFFHVVCCHVVQAELAR